MTDVHKLDLMLQDVLRKLDRIDAVQATHIRDHEKLKGHIEELFRASVHLHKDVHTLDEKLDRIEKLLRGPADLSWADKYYKEDDRRSSPPPAPLHPSMASQGRRALFEAVACDV